MDRDGFMGNSGTERDLVYRDLAMDIVASGVAVVRYDNRGVRCNEMTMPSCHDADSELETTKHYLKSCIDADIRQTVSVETQMDDVHDLWNFLMTHPRIDPQRVVIWAHSEGGLNVARLISTQQIDPKGIIFVGAATESPAEGFRRATTDRYVEHVMGWDSDGDGVVTKLDVEREFPQSQLFADVAMDRNVVMPPVEGWTLETLRERYQRNYEEMKAAALAKANDAPYPDSHPEMRVVAASNAWWRQWFEDTQPMIDHLAAYRGHASFHLGEIDSQCPGRRQLAFAEDRLRTGIFARAPRLVLHKDRGHSLRMGEPAAGPMDMEAKVCLIKEMHEILSTGRDEQNK